MILSSYDLIPFLKNMIYALMMKNCSLSSFPLPSSFDKQTKADLFHNLHLELQECMRNPIAFHAEIMGDIMYYCDAVKEPDAWEFVKAATNEVETHVKNKH